MNDVISVRTLDLVARIERGSELPLELEPIVYFPGSLIDRDHPRSLNLSDYLSYRSDHRSDDFLFFSEQSCHKNRWISCILSKRFRKHSEITK